jgi:PAS domain S-box-containing protein
LTGYSLDEVHGKTPRILKSGEQGPEIYQEMWKAILSGSVFRGILVNRKKNGELYYVEESICPIRDADGKITHFISNGRDLTERLRLEAQLLQAQKMDAIGRLAGGVAHDFNNLLTIITSYSELALDSVPHNSPLESKLQEVLLAARRAAELTRQLLAFSRKQPQALCVVKLNAVVQTIAKTLPRLIGEDIDFSFAPDENLGPVRIDPVQLEQVLMNLAANARDAMPQGGHLQIETSDVRLDDDYIHGKPAVIPKGHYALITVSDEGHGIPAEDLPHVFEPFYTTKPSGKGTGLGLATVYGIVKQNNGFIWVYGEPGSGTIFKIYLPRVHERHHLSEIKETESQNELGGSETILLVEDEAAVRRATAEFSSAPGIQRNRSPGWTGRASAGARTNDDSPGGQRRGYASHERRRFGERSGASASRYPVFLCFRIRGKNHPRPQGGGSGNELPAEALHPEATVVQDSQGAGYRAGWSIGRVTLLELWVCSWWRRGGRDAPRHSRRGRRRYGRPRYNTAGSAPCFFAQRAPFP